MRSLLALPLLVACGATDSVIPARGCGSPDGHCEVDSGRYLALLPEGWNGTDPLPTFIHFHGHGGTAMALRDKASFTDPMKGVGALAIYPDGLNESWTFRDAPREGRDEVAFFDEVLADVRQRWPVDEDRLIVSGFSIGGSVAWDVACLRGAETGAVFAPVSGGFWDPMPTACPGGPIRLRHEHGTDDTVFPLEGRPIGSAMQGDVRESIAVAVDQAGCADPPRIIEEDGRTCTVWDDCTGDAEVQLCLHERPGDHRVTSGWHERALTWAASGGQ